MASKETGLHEVKIEANNITPSTFVAWWRGRGTQLAATTTELHRETREGLDQQLRRVVHRNPLMAMSKHLLNQVVSRAGLGDTLVAWLQKPPA